MHTPTPANVREYLRRIGRDAEFQEILVRYLRDALEDARTTLVKAEPDKVHRLQGYAQAMTDIVELVDPRQPKATAAKPIQ